MHAAHEEGAIFVDAFLVQEYKLQTLNVTTV